MSSNTNDLAADTHNSMRRMVLASLGGAVVLAGCAGRLSATEQGVKSAAKTGGEKVYNAYDRMREFTKGEFDSGEPWVAKQTGNFDLKDARQARLARLKMTNNLVGSRTYIPMFVRLSVAREHLPGGPLLGAAAMFTWQLQVPNPEEFPDLPEGTAILRSNYTARYLDPATMEPVEYLKNPYNGKTMKLEDLKFAENFLNFPLGGSRFVEELQFANDPIDKPKINLFQDFGNEIIMFDGGVYSEPGEHQPRFTENTWTANRDDVMRPDRSLITTRYGFSGVNKAFEKPWAGYSMDDKDLLMDLAYGRKVHSIDDIPALHKRLIVDRYPNRI